MSQLFSGKDIYLASGNQKNRPFGLQNITEALALATNYGLV